MAYPFDDDDKAIMGVQNPSLVEQYQRLAQQTKALQSDKDIAVLFGMVDLVPAVSWSVDALKAGSAAKKSEAVYQSARAAEQQAVSGLEEARRAKERSEEALFVEKPWERQPWEQMTGDQRKEAASIRDQRRGGQGLPALFGSEEALGSQWYLPEDHWPTDVRRKTPSGQIVAMPRPLKHLENKAVSAIEAFQDTATQTLGFDYAEESFPKLLKESAYMSDEQVAEYIAGHGMDPNLLRMQSHRKGEHAYWSHLENAGFDFENLKDADGNFMLMSEARKASKVDEKHAVSIENLNKVKDELAEGLLYARNLPTTVNEREFMLDSLDVVDRKIRALEVDIENSKLLLTDPTEYKPHVEFQGASAKQYFQPRYQLKPGDPEYTPLMESMERQQARLKPLAQEQEAKLQSLGSPDRVKITEQGVEEIARQRVEDKMNERMEYWMPDIMYNSAAQPSKIVEGSSRTIRARSIPLEAMPGVIREHKAYLNEELARNIEDLSKLKLGTSEYARKEATGKKIQMEIREGELFPTDPLMYEDDLARHRFFALREAEGKLPPTKTLINPYARKSMTMADPFYGKMPAFGVFITDQFQDLTTAVAYQQGKGRLRAAKEAGEAAEAAAKRRAKASARVPPTAAEAADMAKAYAETSFKARLPWAPFFGAVYEGYTAHEQQAQMEQQMEEMYKSASAAERAEIDRWRKEKTEEELRKSEDIPYPPVQNLYFP
tara:strand:- start:10127 stop:12286 length:2160 start_codon:yes stop_codon:yes gene_type:complete